MEVHIEKGMTNNEKVSFKGMADEVPGMETGDVNFIVQEKEHELFKRKGADLLVTKDISLNQALCGFTVRLVLIYYDMDAMCVCVLPVCYLAPVVSRVSPCQCFFGYSSGN